MSYFRFKYSGLLDFIFNFLILVNVFCFFNLELAAREDLTPTISEFECLNLFYITGFLFSFLLWAESILSMTIPDG